MEARSNKVNLKVEMNEASWEYRILGELEFENPRKRTEVVTVGFLLSPGQIRSVFREIKSCEEKGYSTDCR